MKLRISSSGWSCRCGNEHGRFACQVPPSPDVMSTMYMEYRRSADYPEKTFKQYLERIGFIDPSVYTTGMDDDAQFVATPGGPQKLAIPKERVTGEVKVKVLLVDFSDQPGALEASHYEDLLFSEGQYPTGSMRDYYKEASHGKVNVTGTVHGWLRMPEPYSYYTNNKSGTDENSYPRNAQRLAEDAVTAALAKNVTFDASLDKFERGIVTALFIIHSGRGAEVMQTKKLQNENIWSHKWNFKNPVKVAPNLSATIYLTVPFNCRVGVCAHELGHLAFEWQDFYDPNYDEDNSEWDGTGIWDLMASGSYNGNGARPAHPAPLHKLQHGWISAVEVKSSGKLTIKPYTATAGQVYKLISPKFKEHTQYLLLENRKKVGFDFDLPGEGLLVWRVDEKMEQNSSARPGLTIIQADGRNDLDNPNELNQGDDSDPFPGSEGHGTLSDTGPTSTSFPGTKSGIGLKNIKLRDDGNITLDVTFAGKAKKAKPAKKGKAGKKAKVGKAKKSKPASKAKKLGAAKARKARAKKSAKRSR